jgi:hypothetical protein
MANGEDGSGGGGGGQVDSGGVGAGLHGERQPNKERVTTPYLTKYERARILGTRALQIRCVELHITTQYLYDAHGLFYVLFVLV